MKTPLLGYVFDAFVIACMTLLVMTGRCEMKDFFIVVSPIAAVRAWQARFGGPPPGIGGSACLFFLAALLGAVANNRNVS